MPELKVFVSDETLARLTLYGAINSRKIEELAEAAVEESANVAFRGQLVGPIYRLAIEKARIYVKSRAAALSPSDSDLTERATFLVNSGNYPRFIEDARAEVEAERKRAAESLGIKS